MEDNAASSAPHLPHPTLRAAFGHYVVRSACECSGQAPVRNERIWESDLPADTGRYLVTRSLWPDQELHDRPDYQQLLQVLGVGDDAISTIDKQHHRITVAPDRVEQAIQLLQDNVEPNLLLHRALWVFDGVTHTQVPVPPEHVGELLVRVVARYTPELIEQTIAPLGPDALHIAGRLADNAFPGTLFELLATVSGINQGPPAAGDARSRPQHVPRTSAHMELSTANSHGFAAGQVPRTEEAKRRLCAADDNEVATTERRRSPDSG